MTAWAARCSSRLLSACRARHHPNTVYGVGTVQEEVGLRGAKTSVHNINPDVAIILEVDIAGDVPGIKPEESAIKLGKGPSLLLYDARMIPNLRLRDLVIATAEENKIPLQFSTMRGGATDGGVIHMHNEGVPTVVLGVPTRHIHSHAGILHRDDYDHALDLLVKLVLRLDEATVERSYRTVSAFGKQRSTSERRLRAQGHRARLHSESLRSIHSSQEGSS